MRTGSSTRERKGQLCSTFRAIDGAETYVVGDLIVLQHILPRLRLTKLSIRVVNRVLAVLGRNVSDVVPVCAVALAVLLAGVTEDLGGCAESKNVRRTERRRGEARRRTAGTVAGGVDLLYEAVSLAERRLAVVEDALERTGGHLQQEGEKVRSRKKRRWSTRRTYLVEAERHDAVAHAVLDGLTSEPESVRPGGAAVRRKGSLGLLDEEREGRSELVVNVDDRNTRHTKRVECPLTASRVLKRGVDRISLTEKVKGAEKKAHPIDVANERLLHLVVVDPSIKQRLRRRLNRESTRI